jgi:hypothetical protein
MWSARRTSLQHVDDAHERIKALIGLALLGRLEVAAGNGRVAA